MRTYLAAGVGGDGRTPGGVAYPRSGAMPPVVRHHPSPITPLAAFVRIAAGFAVDLQTNLEMMTGMRDGGGTTASITDHLF